MEEMTTTLESIEEEKLRSEPDYLGLTDRTKHMSSKMDTTEFDDYKRTVTDKNKKWYIIPEDVLRDFERLDMDLFPYRVSDNVMLIETDVNYNWNIGYHGSYKFIKMNKECEVCGSEGFVLEESIMGGTVMSECQSCGYNDYDYDLDI